MNSPQVNSSQKLTPSHSRLNTDNEEIAANSNKIENPIASKSARKKTDIKKNSKRPNPSQQTSNPSQQTSRQQNLKHQNSGQKTSKNHSEQHNGTPTPHNSPINHLHPQPPSPTHSPITQHSKNIASHQDANIASHQDDNITSHQDANITSHQNTNITSYQNTKNLNAKHHIPLAEQLRPTTLTEIVGQDHLLRPDSLLQRTLKKNFLPSLILWGPPGSGKTTLARLLAEQLIASHTFHFEVLSAVFSSVNALRKIFEDAKIRKTNPSPPNQTLLFVDEIHRFNKAQQDSFLPYVETGVITLIGATTENPSFALIKALLSRTQVLVLKKLDAAALTKILDHAQKKLDLTLPLTEPAQLELIRLADGDGRYLLSLVQNILTHPPPQKPLDKQDLIALLHKRSMLYDKSGDEHYNLISALHKTLRGSDCDAALYYLARMLASGEDPHYIFRRILRLAYEDIGLADPEAPLHVLTGWQTYERLGSPEGEIALAQAVIYLANAPKSNSSYKALQSSLSYAKEHSTPPPPKHILNAPTSLMKNLGYGHQYQYDHDHPDAFSGQNYFPENLPRKQFYTPHPRGFERTMQKRLAYFNTLRQNRNP
ncbi:replication-associated recombination protein A [Spirochaetota bacterium]|nr:replication-associated recombination protein A [Spirochaetota bacterium]